jgi:hypothetical protein
MSLNKMLIENIQNLIESFVSEVSEKYSLDKDDLLSLWTDTPSGPKTAKKPKAKTDLESVDMNDISLERLHKSNKAELIALCKSHGHKCTGTKEILIDRLLGKEQSTNKTTTKKSSPKVKTKTKIERSTASIDVVKKLTSDIPVIPIRRNAHGNLEHPETGLVFNRKTETVVGKQQDDGTIASLTDDDIQECKRYKFKYTIPDCLDKKDNNLDNVKIDELGDDTDIDIVEEEVDEEVEIDEDEEQEDEIVEDDD